MLRDQYFIPPLYLLVDIKPFFLPEGGIDLETCKLFSKKISAYSLFFVTGYVSESISLNKTSIDNALCLRGVYFNSFIFEKEDRITKSFLSSFDVIYSSRLEREHRVRGAGSLISFSYFIDLVSLYASENVIFSPSDFFSKI